MSHWKAGWMHFYICCLISFVANQLSYTRHGTGGPIFPLPCKVVAKCSICHPFWLIFENVTPKCWEAKPSSSVNMSAMIVHIISDSQHAYGRLLSKIGLASLLTCMYLDPAKDKGYSVENRGQLQSSWGTDGLANFFPTLWNGWDVGWSTSKKMTSSARSGLEVIHKIRR